MDSLNEEQRQFVMDTVFRYRKLYGVPGGGKSTCILEKIHYLYEKEFLTSYHDYLVVTFSRQACEDFLKKGKQRNKKLFHTKSIRTIHSTCSSFLYHYKSAEHMNLATLIYECVDMLDKQGLVEDYLQGTEWVRKKLILVDEAQDISELQYRFICKLGELYECPVLLIGDPNQTIFQFQNGTDKYLLQHPGEALLLTYNYRSDAHIVSLLNQFRPWEKYGYITPTRPGKKKPHFVIDSLETCLSHMWKTIIKANCPLHEMAIIAPVKLSHTCSISLSVVANYLNQYGIPFIKHYQESDRDQSYKKTKEISPGKINLYTIHASKGLEFKKVFLCNFHLHTQAYAPDKEEFLENRYLWYVGLSRAMNELYIYGLSDMVLFPTLYDCPSELYTSNKMIEQKPYQLGKRKQNRDILHSIKNFITTKKVLDEDQLFALHKLFHYDLVIEDVFHIDVELYEYDMYSILYGLFMDDWMFYQTVPLTEYIATKRRWFHVKVPLEKDLWIYIKGICKRRGKPFCYQDDFVEYMDPENPMERAILKQIQDTLCQHGKNTYFEFCIDNHVSEYSQGIFETFLEGLSSTDTLLQKIEKVWNIVLFQYQRDYECKYLLEKDFSNHWVTLLPYVEKIATLQYFGSNTLFQIPIADPDIHLKGIMDALDDKNRIYEFKFCQEITLHSYLQVLLYACIHYSSLQGNTVELWNLQKGKRYIFTFTKSNSEEIRDYILQFFR